MDVREAVERYSGRTVSHSTSLAKALESFWERARVLLVHRRMQWCQLSLTLSVSPSICKPGSSSRSPRADPRPKQSDEHTPTASRIAFNVYATCGWIMTVTYMLAYVLFYKYSSNSVLTFPTNSGEVLKESAIKKKWLRPVSLVIPSPVRARFCGNSDHVRQGRLLCRSRNVRRWVQWGWRCGCQVVTAVTNCTLGPC